MTRPTNVFVSERPEGLMADLAGCDRAARPAFAASSLRQLPNRRALAVLDQMFGYYDMDIRPDTVDSSYDAAA